jgi:hypothetical protein
MGNASLRKRSSLIHLSRKLDMDVMSEVIMNKEIYSQAEEGEGIFHIKTNMYLSEGVNYTR